jgi:aspartate racemase
MLQDMNIENDRIIGIVGGMGPQSGLELFNSILAHSDATTDQQHLSSILINLPKHLVDRTRFLGGEVKDNPGVNIAEIIRMMESIGAKVIGIACNTCHAPAIYDVIVERLQTEGSRVKLLNMPMEVCRYVRGNFPQLRRVGVMTTNGTYKTRLYENMLESLGFEAVVPDQAFQDEIVHKMIYDPHFGIKARPQLITPEVNMLTGKAYSFFRDKGAEAIILGCTELSLVGWEGLATDVAIIDSTEVMAKALIREARS